MKRLLLPALAAVIALTARAAEPWRNGERQDLWPSLEKMPDRQPGQLGAMDDEVWIGSFWDKNRKHVAGYREEDHLMPYVEWFAAPAAPVRGCMILVSGGCYRHLGDLDLIRTWKETFTKLGFQTVNLVYRAPYAKGQPIHRVAWEDGQRAVRLVRSQAAKRGFDPEKIGIIGMSAGGHLVTMLATSALTPAYAKVDALDDVPCHVNWAIANAPAYNTVGGSTGNASPQDGTTVVPTINPSFRFDAKTCPMSLHHGAVDPYSPNGSTLCYRELWKRFIPAELHLYADIGHGALGLPRAVEFMRQMGYLGELEPEVNLMTRFASDVARRCEVREAVWPEGRMPDVHTNQCTPWIQWHFPKELKTKAIQIVYSGGAYCGESPGGFEVSPMRRYLNGLGMTVVTMCYRVPHPPELPFYLTAWQDLQRAIRLVRSEAPAYGLDPNRIGLMGSSAGGHLTLLGAFSSTRAAYWPIDALDEIPCNVQWAVALYPAYSITLCTWRRKDTAAMIDDAVPSPEFAFDSGTCPVVFLHGDADTWSSMNSVKCWEKLRAMGVSCDLHTLATRGHTFQKNASPGTGSYTWMDQVWDFLTRKGFNK